MIAYIVNDRTGERASGSYPTPYRYIV